jgi:hypothetical protein
MIVLSNNTAKIQAVMAASSSVTAPQIVAIYYDVPAQTKEDYSEYRGKNFPVNLNHITDVDVVTAPGGVGTVRNVETISIFNTNVITQTVTVKIDDGGTEYIIIRVALATLESLHYEDGQGWYAMTAAGARK